MLDRRLEDQIRQALRADGDRLPLNMTPAELDCRLDRRRRERTGRRVTVAAAAIAVVAIGSMVAIGNGWLRMPVISVAPSESPMSSPVASSAPVAPSALIASSAPSPQPSASASSDARPARSLGGPGDAIVVRSVIDPTSVVHQIEVQIWRAEGDVSVIATYSGILGGNPSLDAPARVSRDGYLAVPLADWRDPERHCCVAIYDLLQPARDPWLIEDLGSAGVTWGPDGRLALFDQLAITILDPATAARTSLSIPAGFTIATGVTQDEVWAANGSGFLAWREEGAVGSPGILHLDGTFEGDSSPPVFDPTGTERVYDSRGRTLAVGCKQVSAGRTGSDCALMDMDLDGASKTWYAPASDADRIADHRWDALAQAVWVLLDRRSGDGKTADLLLLHGGPDTITTVATLSTLNVDDTFDPLLIGLSSDDGRVVVSLTKGAVALVDTASGRWLAAGGSFAGWADQRGAGG